jgi:hypothetical protein
MKNFLIFLLAVSSLKAHAFSENDVQKIKNDKEIVITSFSKREKKEILEKYSDQAVNENIKRIFYSTVYNFLIDDQVAQCEGDFYARLIANFNKANLASDKESVVEHLKMLRSTNAIDDIFYDIIIALNEDADKLKNLDLAKPFRKSLLKHKDHFIGNNVEELYANFKSFPDEKSSCSTQEYFKLRDSVTVPVKDSTKNKVKMSYLETLNEKAYSNKIISLETYNKLEFYRTKSNLDKRYVWLNDYFKIIFNAKDKLVPRNKTYEVKKLEAETNFSSEKLKRFSAMTRRKLLYRKYNETQILLLAQVLQKASRRMGVDMDTITKAPYLTYEYSVMNQNGERENYVQNIQIDPQSQYNLARRLMRKDLVDLQMMSIFNQIEVTYEDLVMASLETGYISLEDLEFVVAYDDLWNPTTSKYERVSGFIFKVAGYTTFFLPPPFNMVASLALGIVEGIVDQRFENGASNDNPGTFIE